VPAQGPGPEQSGHQGRRCPLCSAWRIKGCPANALATRERPRQRAWLLAARAETGLRGKTTQGGGIVPPRQACEAGPWRSIVATAASRAQSRVAVPLAAIPAHARQSELPERAEGHRRAAGQTAPRASSARLERADAGRAPQATAHSQPPQGSARKASTCSRPLARRPRHDQRGCESPTASGRRRASQRPHHRGREESAPAPQSAHGGRPADSGRKANNSDSD